MATSQIFTVNVPTEKENPTVAVKLVLPEGLQRVSPIVKPGWTVATRKTGDGEGANVTEISWAGGQIPAEQRDLFTFSAQAPASETTLVWKTYQTYQDGTVKAWEKEAEEHGGAEEAENAPGPASKTHVINDLAEDKGNSDLSTGFGVSVVALLLAGASLLMQLRKK